jgi:2-phosphosulfolactate phosphatase
MRIEVFLTPRQLTEPLEGAAVVIDVLRASSTITTALAHGAKSIQTTLTEKEALELAQKREGLLLGGERQGIKIEGFHLGNSPGEYTKEVVSDRKIIFTTTNGTRALELARESGLAPILIGCFLNLSALVGKLKELETSKLYLFCAGRAGNFSLEDAAFAGLICQELGGQLGDSAKAAVAIYNSFQGDIPRLLRESEHGRYMQEIGFGSDLALCSEVDRYNLVPVLAGTELIPSE